MAFWLLELTVSCLLLVHVGLFWFQSVLSGGVRGAGRGTWAGSVAPGLP